MKRRIRVRSYILLLSLFFGANLFVHAQTYKTIDTTISYESGIEKPYSIMLDIKWYDSNYNLVQLFTKSNYSKFPDKWFYEKRVLYTYNPKRELIKETAGKGKQYVDSVNHYIKEYKYDGNDTFYLEKEWIRQDTTWRNKGRRWKIYDDQNRLILDSSQLWRSKGTSFEEEGPYRWIDFDKKSCL